MSSRSAALPFLRFIAGRVAGLVLTLLIASVVIFGALHLAPGSPLAFLTQGRPLSPEGLAQLNAHYHLDDPFLVQYWNWLTSVIRGDFGVSIVYNQPVTSLLGQFAVNTIFLVGFASLIILVLGVGVGCVAGLRPGWVDGSVMLIATATMAIPTFISSVVLVAVFSVGLRWFPVFGPGDGFGDRIYHLVLPAAALALVVTAFVARLTRAAVREETAADHVQTAVSRGLPHPVVVRRHVLRNAAVPILTIGGLAVSGLIASSVIVEQVFKLNGLGSQLVTAVQYKDFPIVQAICMIFVAVIVVLNTLIDIAYSLLDPRIRTARATR